MRSTQQLVLTAGHLSAQLRDAAERPYLEIRSLVDVLQVLLLPLPTPPAIDGLALATRLGRWHDLPWGLAWGAGVPPAGCTVVFGTSTLRFRSTVRVTPLVLDGRCWVASAEGLFTSAATVVDGVETARVPLASRY